MEHSSIALVAMAQNAALLLAAALLFDVFASRWHTGQLSISHKLVIGFALGIIGMTVMLSPWTFVPGIVFDTRSVLIGSTGLFFGAIPAVITMAMTSALRIHLGGSGVMTGICVIVASGMIGIAWRHWKGQQLENISWGELFLFGMVLHLVMLTLMFTLPRETARQVILEIALPVLIIYPLGTALLGSLMVRRLSRERTEEAVRNSNRLLEDVLNAIPDIIGIQKKDRSIVRYNRAGYEALGLNHEQVAGNPCYSLIGRKEPCEICATSLVLKSKKLETLEIFVPELNRHLLCRSNPIFDGKGELRLIIEQLHDITERKRTEEALRERERRAAAQRTAIAQLALDESIVRGQLTRALERVTEVLSVTMNVARASIWKLSHDGSELHCLALYERDKGLHAHGAVLKTDAFPNYFEAIASQKWINAEDARSDPRTIELKESYLVPQGIASMLDAAIIVEGRMVGIVCLEHTGTQRIWHTDEEVFSRTTAAIVAQILLSFERKKAEEERENLHLQLVQAQKMESVGRLAGGVAHDFNNMLGVILGHTEMALDEVDPAQPIFAHLQQIQNAAERSAALTGQLLAFARRQTVSPKVLDLNETLEGMLQMLLRLIGEHIHLDWIPGRNLWPVKVDPNQVDQILTNLCINARDALGDKGKVTIQTSNETVEEDPGARDSGSLSGDYVLMTVRDNGCGMDQETLNRLFEPFFTTKELGKGTGLGLATVYGIVRQNQGFIRVHSKPGQGTLFKIYFPRHTAEDHEESHEPLQKKGENGHETILLVEDEPAILRMTRMMLEQKGYTVLSAANPHEAMNLARKKGNSIQLIITDVVMPQMNGRNLAAKLRSRYPHLKCLYMSGYTCDVIARHGVLNEGVHFIQKPFSMEDLASKVRESLDAA